MPLVTHEELAQFDTRVVVAGGRNYNDYLAFSRKLAKYFKMLGSRNFVIVSGKAPKGADAMAIRWAQENGCSWAEFPAQWDRLDAPGAVVRTRFDGKQYNVNAGFVRNLEMRKACTHIVAFWDLESRGTEHMINSGLKEPGIEVFVFVVEPDRVLS